MDDHLYTLWETEKCTVNEVLYKAIDKIGLAQRINVAIDQGRGPEMESIDEEDALETV